MRTFPPSEFILVVAEFSKNFQAFLENYCKKHFIDSLCYQSFREILRKLRRIRLSNSARNSPCAIQIHLHGQFSQCDNLTHFVFESKLTDI